MKYWELLVLKWKVFLFTVIYEGHDRPDDEESAEWIREVEKNIVEAFMYLNINRVLKSIGYISKDIWTSDTVGKGGKGKPLNLSAEGNAQLDVIIDMIQTV